MRTPSVERFAEARGNSPNCRRSFRLPESNYNVEAGLPAESANCHDVAGNEPAFSGDQQAHRKALRFVVVGAMQQVGAPHFRAKTYSGPGSLRGGSAGHEGTHDGVDFAEALVQAALGGDGVGGDQSGEDADVHFVLDRPETMLAGRIGKCGISVRRKTLCLHGGAQQKNREEEFHGGPQLTGRETTISQRRVGGVWPISWKGWHFSKSNWAALHGYLWVTRRTGFVSGASPSRCRRKSVASNRRNCRLPAPQSFYIVVTLEAPSFLTSHSRSSKISRTTRPKSPGGTI